VKNKATQEEREAKNKLFAARNEHSKARKCLFAIGKNLPW